VDRDISMDQYKRLTIPSRAKEPQNGHNSKIHRNSQFTVEDQITLDLPAIPYENPWTQQTDALNVLLPVTIPFPPRSVHHNGHSNGNQVSAFPTNPFPPRSVHHNGSAHNGSIAIAFQPVGIPFAADSQINGVTRRTEHTTWESPTVSTSHSKGKATSKWRFLFELPHLLVYMVGALAIFGLYLLIPLLILLNATFRGSLNTLIVALGIMTSGELLVCIILARTIPRGKMKKRRAFAKS
jgi:hypothetical protein